MIKKCKDCGEILGNDRKTGKYWCQQCKDVKEDCNQKYRIVLMGKNAGKSVGIYNFINCMGKSLERLGHEIVYVPDDYLFKIVPQYDFANCFHYKKPINLKQVQYEFDPDFIYIEQMYYRFNIDEITCPVIYQHREYTHFPDILNPDILLTSYYWRLETFEFYNPWEYQNIPYKDTMLVAVEPELIKAQQKKILSGIYHIGWSSPIDNFKEANGPFCKMVMEEQERYFNKCVDMGYVQYIGGDLPTKEFHDVLGKCEALLFDGGYYGETSRRLFEAAFTKTLIICRIYSKDHYKHYKDIGLTDDMCFFIKEPKDIEKISFTEEQRKEMVEKTFEWVMNNHTYDCRAKKLLDIFEEFKNGKKKDIKFMGWATKHKLSFEGEGVQVD